MAKPRSSAQLKEYKRKRNFSKTAEPSGAVYAKRSKRLEFVVQKHEASHLHYDIRLEVDGVMKSWACPKGPSFDPSVKRLAVEVEDHPTTYNGFEGTIPAGEYGGGTVMVWDKGYYTVDDAEKGDDPEALMREGIEKGKLAFSFHGEKLKGSFTLVRTRLAPGAKKPQWLLIKHRDEFADPDYDPIAETARSALSQKTMKEIASGTKAPKGNSASAAARSKSVPKPSDPDRRAEAIRSSLHARKIGKGNKTKVSSALKPMLLHKTEVLLEGEEYVYEQKLDGVRLLAYSDGESWTVVSRLGNDKSQQFPELGPGLLKLAQKAKGPLILDGEVVAVDGKGRALGFQALQGRIHIDDAEAVKSATDQTPIAFFVFDILLHGEDSLMERSLRERRAKLETLFPLARQKTVRLNPVYTSAKAMRSKADREAWEGLIIKDVDSPYLPGVRTKSWLKWKLAQREELLICGWTVPRGSRTHIGSLLLGYYDEAGKLVFAGHVGSGFDAKTLKDIHAALKARERKTPPFSPAPATNEKAHWVKPELIAEVKFQEWTSEGVLRHGSFLGIRDDKEPKEIVHSLKDLTPHRSLPSKSKGTKVSATSKATKKPKKSPTTKAPTARMKADFHAQLESIQEAGNKQGEGLLDLKEGELRVTHLDKVVFPRPKITKQDLLEYYFGMAEFVLPWMNDRPLVLRRFPQGITGKDFYQQAPDADAPGRIVTLEGEAGDRQDRFVGGDLRTLLYLIQMGCISYDPWHARVDTLAYPDYTIIDLDPVEGTSFATVRSVALAVLDVLEGLKFSAAVKTSGATGIHIYLPLPLETTWETGRLVAEIICAKVAEVHPKATVERRVRSRPKGSVYLDSQQNYLSKSVAGVWSVRARTGGTVSTPVTRKELEDGVVPRDFTLNQIQSEAKVRSEIWRKAMLRAIDVTNLSP